MTWCSKIYDMFNGWTDEEQTLAIESARRSTINDIIREDPDTTPTPILQHDSPFLEKSDSIIATKDRRHSLFNTDHSIDRDYRGEHICADTFFSCHQRDGPYYYNLEERPYGIATISNMSLNLPKTIENPPDKYQQQLSRSFSFELPTQFSSIQHSLPSMDDISPRVRYSLNQTNTQQRLNANQHKRFSLKTLDRNHRATLEETRQDSFGYRVSTRSSSSLRNYDSQDFSHRTNEQIAELVQYNIKEMFNVAPNGVFPMIFRLPADAENSSADGYRVEGSYGEPSQWILQTKIHPNECRIMTNNIAAFYSQSFYDQYHFNLYGIDRDFNPVVMSIKPHDNRLSVIVRTKDGSKSMEIDDNDSQSSDYTPLSRRLFPELQIEHMESCTQLKAQHHIKSYDDKLENQKFKFAIIYQRRGQTTEEEFFNNERHNRTFDEFLETIATRVSLKNFKGYRGGLDVSEQTDSPISYYEVYEDKEIMFHVSTLLPFTPNDSTQIQRKRHIGNDIVGIVFQEENTPFHPSMIKSNFLHIFLVIQPAQLLSRSCYKMMLVARDDIGQFPPCLYPNIVYVRTAEQLKPFILSKLINAEYAAYQCRTFALLQERTRCSYLKILCENLSEKPYEHLCDEQKRSLSHRRLSILSNPGRKRYLSSMKKIFTRSSTLPDETRSSIKSDQGKTKSSKKFLRIGKSVDLNESHRSSDHESTRDNEDNLHHGSSRHRDIRSDDSLNSNDEQRSSTLHQHSAQVYYGDESDEGLDSMSSAETTRVPYDSDDQETYRKQIREKSQPTQIWQRLPNPRSIQTPQTPGIHMSEASTV